MQVRRLLLSLLVVSCVCTAAHGQRAFGIAESAARLRGTMRLAALRAYVETRIADASLDTADDHLFTAELLKQIGDPRAMHFFEEAIRADSDEPLYELFYADYLRNFRGPRRPLFIQAQEHYFEALRKLRAQKDHGPVIVDRIDRGLVALFQEDGLPLWSEDGTAVLSLTSVLRSARSMSELDEVHDARDFTAEALFASSGVRLGRALTLDELRSIARVKEPAAMLQRLRLRSEGVGIDLFYDGRRIGDARITNSYEPGTHNDVALDTAGVAMEFAGGSERGLDGWFRAGSSWSRRTGVVEFLPSADETIKQYDLHAAFARFVGPDKMTVEAVYAKQEIVQDIDDPPDHDRTLAALNAEYSFLRPLPFLGNPYGHLFALRGIHLRGVVALDLEDFPTRVSRFDYSAGISINGLGPFDVAVQPTLIKARVSGDPRQTQSQIRTDASLLIRLLDEERQPGIPRMRFLGLHPAFVHLVIPFKRDSARDGLDAFDNERIGVLLAVKLFRRALSPSLDRVRPATVLATVRYDRQRFPKLDLNERLVSFSISVGY